MIIHMIFNQSNQLEYSQRNKPLLINQLIYFYCFKSSYPIVQRACFEDKGDFLSQLYFLLHLYFFNYYQASMYNKRLIIWRLVNSSCTSPALSSKLVPKTVFTNVFYRQLIETYIKQIRDYILVIPRKNTDKPLQLQFLDLYYVYSYIQYYYFSE